MRKRRPQQVVIGALVIILLFTSFIAFRNYAQDPDQFVQDSTADWISALEMKDGRIRAVAFDEEGKLIEPPASAKQSFEDRDPAWSATGSHIFFSSNRESNSFSIMRWRPAAGQLEERAGGTRSLTAPYFTPTLMPGDDLLGLMIGGGQVMQFDPKARKTYQLLPPNQQSAGMGGEGGSADPMTIYEKFGTSFRQAMATPDGSIVYTIMRSDEGDALVLNFLRAPEGSQNIPPPAGLMAGERITMDMAADGTLVAGVEGFRWPDPENIPPEAIKDGRPQAPYRNAVVAYRLEGGIPKLVTMAAVPNDESGFFIDPAISPDGARIVASLVRRATPAADLEYNGLIIMPVEEGGAGKGQGLLPGEASQPDWNGDGSRIVFLKKAVGERQIYVVNADGSGEKRISELGRDYMRPRFSPQIPG
jgi:hypothetical protein